MSVLHLPERLPAESLDAIKDSVHVLGDARARLGSFADEVRTELGELREQLCSIHVELEEELRELHERTSQFESERAAFESESRSAEQLSVKLVAAQSRLEQSQSQLTNVQNELNTARSRLSDTEQDRDTVRQQLTEVTEEMSALSELVDLVKTTHEELLAAQSESRSARQQIREECESAFRSEMESLRNRTQELERELAQTQLAAQTLTEQLRQQEAELQGYREQWSRELDRVRTLLDARSGLIETAASGTKSRSKKAPAEVSASKAPAAGSDTPPFETDAATTSAGSPKASAKTKVPPAAEEPPKSDCPVIGSVLAEFAKLKPGSEE
jgi:chromosome segregation ATPase